MSNVFSVEFVNEEEGTKGWVLQVEGGWRAGLTDTDAGLTVDGSIRTWPADRKPEAVYYAAKCAGKLTFEVALARFIAVTQREIDAYYAVEFPRNTVPRLGFSEGGQKYVRIYKFLPTVDSRDAFCFVEVATGNVLYPDGWKRPAKGVRGSIYADDFEGFGVTQYGAKRAR